MKAANQTLTTVTDERSDSWKLVPIKAIADINPKLDKSLISDKLMVSFVPMQAVGAGDGTINVSNLRPAAEVKKGFTNFQEGDVLFAKITPCMENGKMAIVPKVASGYGFGSTEFHVLRPRNGFDPRYLYYFVSSQSVRKEAAHNMIGAVGQKRVSTSYIADLEIPLAPYNQQRLIVAEIEKQFSRLDEAVANIKRVKANLKRYKAAVLKAAVEGRLTEEWRKTHSDVGPASALLKRILVERKKKWEESELAKMKAKGKKPKDDKWKAKYVEAQPPKPEDIFEIPNTWVWTNLGQLSWSVKDGPHFSPKYSESGIPFISGGNIRPDGIDFTTAKYISPELHAEFTERCNPELGDLLYTKGGTTGIARINTEKREFSVWVHVAVLKLVDSIERLYLQYSLNSLHCYRQSQRYTHGVGNQDLGLTRMIWITVPLPPLEEQKEIVKVIEERMSVVVGIEKEIDANLKRAESLRQSVLKSAFTGNLLSE